MAWYNSLKDLTHDVAHPVVEAGHAIGSVASNPWVQGITAATLAATGVGAPAAAAILAAQHGVGNLIKPGGNIGSAIKGGVEGAAEGAAASKIGSLVKGATGAAGSGGFEDWLKNAVTSGGGGVLKTIGSKLGLTSDGSSGGAGGGDLLGKLLLGGSVAAGAADQARKTGFQNQAVDYSKGAYDAKAPLRAQAIAGLQDRSTPDLSSIFSSPGNIYDKQRRAAMPAPTPTVLPAPAPPSAPTTGPMVLGQPAPAPQAAAGMDAVQKILASGTGGLHSILNAARTGAAV